MALEWVNVRICGSCIGRDAPPAYPPRPGPSPQGPSLRRQSPPQTFPLGGPTMHLLAPRHRLEVLNKTLLSCESLSACTHAENVSYHQSGVKSQQNGILQLIASTLLFYWVSDSVTNLVGQVEELKLRASDSMLTLSMSGMAPLRFEIGGFDIGAPFRPEKKRKVDDQVHQHSPPPPDWQAQIEDLRSEHKSSVEKLYQSITDLRKEHQLSIEEIREEHRQFIASLQEAFTSLHQPKGHFEVKVHVHSEPPPDWQAQIVADLRAGHSLSMAELLQSITGLQKEHQHFNDSSMEELHQSITDLCEEHRRSIEAIREEHRQSMVYVRNQIMKVATHED